MFQSLLSLLLTIPEALFPMVPNKTLRDVGLAEWHPTYIYYVLHDPSPRLKQRLLAVLTLDRSMVSFYRKRRYMMPYRQELERVFFF
jgi:hypothetical protein